MTDAAFSASTVVLANASITMSLTTSATLVNFTFASTSFHLHLTELDAPRFHKEDIKLPLPFLFMSPTPLGTPLFLLLFFLFSFPDSHLSPPCLPFPSLSLSFHFLFLS